MKIGILTFHRALNYGAVLQCYALYITLTSMGHNVEVIDYRPEAIEKYRKLFRLDDFFKKEGFKKKVKYLLSSLVLIYSKKKTAKKFDDFIKENIHLSKIVKHSEDIPSYYDMIFFGSDQIWNPSICEGMDEIYYGQFPKGKTKFISYAASVGRLDLLNNDLLERFLSYISIFDRLSVREKNLYDLLTMQYGIESKLVCDPSLFLTEKICNSIAKDPDVTNYILVYDLERNPSTPSFAKKIAMQLNTKIISMSAETNHFHKCPIKTYSEISPAEFLGYIKNAKCVITNSFHVTSFALIMKKDFYTIIRKDNNDRSSTILSFAGLGNRQIELGGDPIFTKVNYSGVKEKLDKYKKYSYSYLSEAVSL